MNDVLGYLKNRGIVCPSGWMVSPEYSEPQVLDVVNLLIEEPIKKEDLREMLRDHNIRH
jgi:hypothetical protein